MQLSPELVPLIQARTPRYTSYPTAPSWHADVDSQAIATRLASVRGPAGVYVHLPFCAEQCSFCACNQVVAGRREAGTRYLAALRLQLDALPHVGRLPVQRIHLGGGTPTWHTAAELRELMQALSTRFTLLPGAELDVEADPEITTDEQIEELAALGTTRVSMGVQSFDPGVLEAVGRPQRAERIGSILGRARALGMRGLNIDLMYGLPRQTEAVFAADLDAVIDLGPDRVAIFGYAHVPWLKPHQKRLEAYGLSDGDLRLKLFLMAHERMAAAGYVAIGFDHFARPDDALTQAAQAGTLHRNFMGYTTLPDVEVIGLGTSAISELRDAYVQQTTHLGRWYRQVEDEATPLRMGFEKGMLLSDEDRMRRALINGIMCNLRLDWQHVRDQWGVDVPRDLATELAALAPLCELDLVVLHEDGLTVTERGRFLVRNIAAVFDSSLGVPGDPALPRFSRAI